MRRSLLAWTVDTRPEVTDFLYRAVGGGSARRCGCAPCLNFDQARPAHFPEAFRVLLAELRIDPAKEAAVRLVSPLEGNNHLYFGAYGFHGILLAGRPFRGFPIAKEEVDVFERVGGDVQVALRTWVHPPPPWSDGATVSLEFLVVLPWLLPADGPPPVGPRSVTC